MKPLIIFPQQPFEKGVDYAFIDEYQAALNVGLECYLVNLSQNNIHIKAPDFPESKKGIYRGWMLNSSQYKKMYYQLLNDYNIQLINTPFEYEATHHFLNFYPVFSEVTIPSVITHGTSMDKKTLRLIGKQLQSKKLFLKDWVKSESDNIIDLSDDSSGDGGLKIIEKFVENRGKSFEGGLVFRTFVELSQFETRYWVLNGEILNSAILCPL